MQKSRYSLSKTLPSTSVNIDLLKDLENYILNEVFKLLGISSREAIRINALVNKLGENLDLKIDKTLPNFKEQLVNSLITELRQKDLNSLNIVGEENQRYSEKYQFIITDNFGEEEYNKAASFNKNKFDNQTNGIKLQYTIHDYQENTSLEIKLLFGHKRSNSELLISMTSNRAKELVKGIQESILQIIKNYQTSNFIYSEETKLGRAIPLLSVSSIFLVLYLIEIKRHEIAYLVSFCILAFTFGRMHLRKLKPYSEFDTRAQNSRNDIVKWLIRLVIGFFITGIIFTAFRKSILHF
jgi:hypothetical protein